MSESHKNPDGWGTAFSVVLFILTAIICVAVVVSFSLGWYQYSKGDFIDYQRNLLKRDDAKWLIVLFCIPIILQIVGLCAMFMRLHRDRSMTAQYACFMFIMSCPSSYCVLWAFYLMGYHSSEILSYVALGAIGFLLVPVIVMTYAIMWTPRRQNPAEIEKKDFEDFPRFCSELKNGAAFGVNGGAFSGYRTRILECLDNDLRAKLIRAENKEDYNLISQELIGGLNKILRNPDLHLTVDSHNQTIPSEARELLIRGQKKLTPSDWQRLHRLLLEVSFPDSIHSSQDPDLSRLRRYSRKAWHSWEKFLYDMKEGITKAHFWVLTNFFAVFLGVTFLFAFAFAFHDQAAFANNNTPDLYMAKTPLAGAVVQQLGNSGATQESEAPQTEVRSRYTFYFDSSSAHLNWIEHTEFNDKPYAPNGEDLSKNWKYGVNYSRLERITADILKLTEKGQKLQIELLGSTDYCDLQAAPYSSNYELSEARAQQLKYLVIDRLLKKDQRQRDIEWFVLPLSSEVSPVTVLPAGDTEVVDCNNRSTPITQKKRAHLDSTKALVAELENYKNTFPPMQPQLGPDGVKDLQDQVDELIMYVGNNHLSSEAIRDPRGRIATLAQAMTDVNVAKHANESSKKILELTKDKTKKEVELQESLDAFKFVDQAAGMRVVAISLRPVESGFMPLSLMDYMYFTIYTITTTGYGDIVPTTTFAKFLCSAANILEVFFLVVFFNALLSVRGENRFSRVTDKNKS
jgi:hypothetical protein